MRVGTANDNSSRLETPPKRCRVSKNISGKKIPEVMLGAEVLCVQVESEHSGLAVDVRLVDVRLGDIKLHSGISACP
jgi:hypothetical protein